MKITKKNLINLINESIAGNIVSREFYSINAFNGFNVASNVGNISHKPKGLWYSCNEEWKEWCRWDAPHWYEAYNFKYDIEVDLSKMLVIRNEQDFRNFEQNYAADINPRRPGRIKAINWEAVSEDYSGIEICPYLGQFRMSNSKWYYTWDIASGCVWDSSAFIAVNHAIKEPLN